MVFIFVFVLIYFYKVKMSVCVYCSGFHHTLVIAVPPAVAKRESIVYSSSVYSFGWGEQGRLGLGNEDRAFIPMHVHFPQGHCIVFESY